MSEHTCVSNFVLNKLETYLNFKDIQMKVDIRKVERVAVAVQLSLYENSRQNKLTFSSHRILSIYHEFIPVDKKLMFSILTISIDLIFKCV